MPRTSLLEQPTMTPEDEEVQPVTQSEVEGEFPELVGLNAQIEDMSERFEELNDKPEKLETFEQTREWLKSLDYMLPRNVDSRNSDALVDTHRYWDSVKGEYVEQDDGVKEALLRHRVEVGDNLIGTVISFPDGMNGTYVVSFKSVEYTTDKGTDGEYTDYLGVTSGSYENKIPLLHRGVNKYAQPTRGMERRTRSKAVNKALGNEEDEWTSADTSIKADGSVDDEKNEELEKLFIERVNGAKAALEVIFDEMKEELLGAVEDEMRKTDNVDGRVTDREHRRRQLVRVGQIVERSTR